MENFPYDNLLQTAKKIHFVGIGGSGMCPLAEILHKEGYQLTGSDINPTDTLKRIEALGIPVTMGHHKENVQGADLVVHTAAVMQDNPELVAAREQNIPLIERSVLLGAICRRYPNTIAVCGTHGKTTVTSMITQVLLTAGLDPSAIIGGKLPLIQSNGRAGQTDTMVCEACEFVDTFLQITPAVAVILNIDEDHLDYFKTLDNIIASFHKFCLQTSREVLVNGDDENSLKAVRQLSIPVVTFGMGDDCDYQAKNVEMLPGQRGSYDVWHKGQMLGRITLNVPGRHNVLNSLAAVAVCLRAGAPMEQIQSALQEFGGAGRRFEILYRGEGPTIADDYAHHPRELTVVLEAAAKMGYHHVWAVFQPFTFSRTALLMDDFAKALSLADKVVLTPIMGAREVNTYGVDSTQLQKKIPGSVLQETFEEVARYVVQHAQKDDLVITLGCGDIYKAAKLMIKMLP